MMQRGKTPAEMSRYLLARGIWLLVLELLITPIGWRFSFHLLPAFGLVLWALGWSMIVMALLLHLSRAIVAAVAVLMIGGHNLLDSVQPGSFGALAPLWHVLHVPGFVIPGALFIAYPLVPWIGVMALGYLIADVYGWEASRRRRFLISCGAAAAVIFVALRALNGYGNPDPWSAQRSQALTVASFLNVRKYPPSLLFLLMTLGPALVALALAAGVVLSLLQGGELRRIPIMTDPASLPEWYGVSLGGVYVAWVCVVLVMYYPCRAFARLKETRSDWWLRYL